jgi:hypothetical protein
MSNLNVVLNSEGIQALLKSDEMKAICEEHAQEIRSRCGDGYEMDSRVGKTRVNAMVYADTVKAKRDNSKNNTILKALR